jgi:hypothetical protein
MQYLYCCGTIYIIVKKCWVYICSIYWLLAEYILVYVHTFILWDIGNTLYIIDYSSELKHINTETIHLNSFPKKNISKKFSYNKITVILTVLLWYPFIYIEKCSQYCLKHENSHCIPIWRRSEHFCIYIFFYIYLYDLATYGTKLILLFYLNGLMLQMLYLWARGLSALCALSPRVFHNTKIKQILHDTRYGSRNGALSARSALRLYIDIQKRLNKVTGSCKVTGSRSAKATCLRHGYASNACEYVGIVINSEIYSTSLQI